MPQVPVEKHQKQCYDNRLISGDLYGIPKAPSNRMVKIDAAKSDVEGAQVCSRTGIKLRQIDFFVVAMDDLCADLRGRFAFFRLLLREERFFHAC